MTLRLALVALTLIAAVGPAAGQQKDTPAARFTRVRKLNAKITIDVKQMMMRDIFKELSGQLRDLGLSGLGVKYARGVSANQRLDLKVTEEPLKVVLDKLLKQSKLGYIVMSERAPARKRYDGWIEVRLGEERGWEKGKEPKEPLPDAPAAPDTPMTPKKDDGEPELPPLATPQRLERIGDMYLRFAEVNWQAGKRELAKRNIEKVLKRLPGTKAAAAAGRMMAEYFPGEGGSR